MRRTWGRFAVVFIVSLGGLAGMAWLLAGTGSGSVWAGPDTEIIRVAESGSDAPGCGTIVSPCLTLQYAIDTAADGDEMRIATGVYTDIHSTGTLSQVAFIDRDLLVRGGYSVGNWDVSDPAGNPTVLNAQGRGRVLVVSGTVTVTLEGLTVTGGDAAGLGGAIGGYDGGGGLFVYSSTVTVSDCAIYSNTASTTSEGRGGGLYARGGHVTISGNQIHDNVASAGGGGGLFEQSQALLLTGNEVYSNVATGRGGGGFFVIDSSGATVTGNSLFQNSADASGGGLFLYRSDGLQVSGNVLGLNSAGGSGGGIYLRYCDQAVVSANTIWSNHALDAPDGDGGGIHYQEGVSSLFEGNVVHENTAVDDGGGIYLDVSTNITLTGNHIAGNQGGITSVSAGGGVGMVWNNDDIYLTGNTIYGNTAGAGGGIGVVNDGHARMCNNIVTGNWGEVYGTALWMNNDSTAQLCHNTIANNPGPLGSSGIEIHDSSLVLTNTILASHTVGVRADGLSTVMLDTTLWHATYTETEGAGTVVSSTNYYGDPAFVDGEGGDCHITAGSAAINQARDIDVVTDIDGQQRPVGTGPDIGADEFVVFVYLPLAVRDN
jgi:parallel beta-helix repeat protein